MKIREGFVLREIAGAYVVIALGNAGKIFNGMIHLNETGKLIWEMLSEGSDESTIIDTILQQYEIDKNTAQADVHRVIAELQGAGILE